MSRAAARTLLVHHRSGIGDLVWHIPYLRVIAAGSEGGCVDVVARPSCRAAQVLAAEPVGEVFEFDRHPRRSERRRGRHDALGAQWAFVRTLRRRGYERVFIFAGSTRMAALMALAGIPQRAGFGFSAWERLLLNQPPYIRRYRGAGNWVYPEATAFAIAQGLVTGPVLPRMAVLPAALDWARAALRELPQRRIAFSIGTSDPRKHWGEARYAALAGQLAASGLGVILLGGPAEAASAQQIVGALPASLRAGVLPMTQPSVQRSAAVLKLCGACVGNDTGVLNIAVAVETPALGLFGFTGPLPHDPQLRALSGAGMDSITVDAVLRRLRDEGLVPE